MFFEALASVKKHRGGVVEAKPTVCIFYLLMSRHNLGQRTLRNDRGCNLLW